MLPINHACGHLDNSDGVTGAAPIWHKDMVAATARFNKADWYTMPKDVVQVGTGNDADFFLPGTQSAAGGGNCFYWGPPGTPPPPQPPGSTSPCVYTGTGPPAQTPQPGTTQPVHGHRPKPTPTPPTVG
jgi:hypothetical protein